MARFGLDRRDYAARPETAKRTPPTGGISPKREAG
jgi:hypothetical protein